IAQGPRQRGQGSGASASALSEVRVTLAAATAPLKRTPLHALHVALGARMVPFAGYEMPVQDPTGIVEEHWRTRSRAGFFGDAHMGQARIVGPHTAQALERLVPGDIRALKPDRMR